MIHREGVTRLVDTRNAVKQQASKVCKLGAPAFREAPAVEMA